MNKRHIGKYYEEAAAAYLQSNNIRIIARNVHCGRLGEIDLIGEGEGCLIFFEVKYRAGSSYGSSLEAITETKKKRLRKCAAYYLAYRDTDKYVRFDVCGFDNDEFVWIKNAF